MKPKILSTIIAGVLLVGQLTILAQTTPSVILTLEPTLSLTNAIVVAQKYVADNKIDVTQLFLQSATAIYTTDNPQGGWLWRITWAPKGYVRGGQIYLFVSMDGSISIEKGR